MCPVIGRSFVSWQCQSSPSQPAVVRPPALVPVELHDSVSPWFVWLLEQPTSAVALELLERGELY